MVTTILVFLAAQVKRTGYVSLRAEPEGILLDVSIWDEGRRAGGNAFRAKVELRGPDGIEPNRLRRLSQPRKGPEGTVAIEFDRSPNAGWRTITADISSIPGLSIPGSRKDSIRFYLPAANPSLEDAAMRSNWVGKPVWLFGAAVADGERTLGWNPQDPVTIIDCKRHSGPVLFGFGNPVWSPDGWTSDCFLCGGYLDLTVRLPKGAWSTFLMSNNLNESRLEDRQFVFAPIEAHLGIADWWQMSRVLSATSPAIILRKESAEVCEAFCNRKVVRGMPRSLVAMLVGDPEPAAPAADVWRRSRWNWFGGPFNGEYGVWFDRNGRVKDFGWIRYDLP